MLMTSGLKQVISRKEKNTNFWPKYAYKPLEVAGTSTLQGYLIHQDAIDYMDLIIVRGSPYE